MSSFILNKYCICKCCYFRELMIGKRNLRKAGFRKAGTTCVFKVWMIKYGTKQSVRSISEITIRAFSQFLLSSCLSSSGAVPVGVASSHISVLVIFCQRGWWLFLCHGLWFSTILLSVFHCLNFHLSLLVLWCFQGSLPFSLYIQWMTTVGFLMGLGLLSALPFFFLKHIPCLSS